jgi:arginine decarboxylase
VTPSSAAPRIDHFFSAVAARHDLWRDLNRAAQAWAASPTSRNDAKLQAACTTALGAVLPMEDFQAYPGGRLINALKERQAGGDAIGVARLVQRVSSALMTRSYRSDPGEWESEDDASEAERVMPTALGESTAKPYFEVLFVTPTPPSRWPAHVQQIRKLRRPMDEFIYEPVMVGSFEDAVLAVILNTNLESVVIYDGFPFASSRDVPLLKEVLASRLSLDAARQGSADSGLLLAKAIKRFRPELDIIMLADRKPDAMISDPAAEGIRRVFYETEEPLEIHLSILSGVAERNVTPFFDNLKKYAQKPVGTFHALPVARGKSIFKSDWIRDMGEFYGANLFLAESSATSGGLDSLLEPTGNIKKAQDLAARASAPIACSSSPTARRRRTRWSTRRCSSPATSSSPIAIATSRTTTAWSSPARSRTTSRPSRWWRTRCTARCRSAVSRRRCSISRRPAGSTRLRPSRSPTAPSTATFTTSAA